MLPSLLPTRLPANVPGMETKLDGSSTWVPGAQIGEQDGIPGSWL